MIRTNLLGRGCEGDVYGILGSRSKVVKVFKRTRCYGWLCGTDPTDPRSWAGVSDSICTLYSERKRLERRNKRRSLNVPIGTVRRFAGAWDRSGWYFPPIVHGFIADQIVYTPTLRCIARPVRVFPRPRLSEAVYERLGTGLLEYIDSHSPKHAKSILAKIFKLVTVWYIRNKFCHNDLSHDNVMVKGHQAVVIDFAFATWEVNGKMFKRADYDFERPELEFGPFAPHPVRDFIELCESIREDTTNVEVERWIDSFLPPRSAFTSLGYLRVPVSELTAFQSRGE